MRRLGTLRGKTLVVSGATGGVGAVAVEIGRKIGADVVALNRGSPAPPPASVDAVLDGVAGSVFPALVAALRPNGCYCMVGAAGRSRRYRPCGAGAVSGRRVARRATHVYERTSHAMA
jgi:NADPH:quinone reductase-like Zn-dependent oxidoreductase